MYIYNNFLICALSSFFSILAYYLFFNTFGEARFSKRLTALFLSGTGTLFTLAFYFTSPGILRVMCLFTCNILTSLLVKLKWYNCIALNLIGYAVAAISEFVVAGSMSLLFNADMNDVKNNTFIYLMGLILSKIVIVLIFGIIRVQKHKLLVTRSKKHLFTLLLFPLASILVIVLQYRFFLEISAENQELLLFTIIVYFILIFSNVYIFYYIDNMQENIDKSIALENANELIDRQAKQYSELLSYQDGIMKIQHDHKNFILGVIHEMESGNFDAVQEKLRSEYDLLSRQYLSCGGNIIQNIIDIKSGDLKNIKITLEYKDLHKIAISSADIAVMLGNALDNAIEAVKKIKSETEKIIEVVAQVKNDMILLIIKNPTAGKVDVNNLTTTKRDKHSHGYGILSIQNLAKKYDGVAGFEWKDHQFVTSIVINNTPKQLEKR